MSVGRDISLRWSSGLFRGGGKFKYVAPDRVAFVSPQTAVTSYTDPNIGYFRGALDDVRIYDRVLTAQDVQLLHATERGAPLAQGILAISVKTVRIDMSLQPGLRYQLVSSADFKT